MDHEAAKTLFLEQAAAYYDDLKSAADNAPYGKVIDKAELFAIVQGRELICRSREAVVQERIIETGQEQKKRHNAFLRRWTASSRIHSEASRHRLEYHQMQTRLSRVPRMPDAGLSR